VIVDFHDGQRALQDQFDTRRIAERIDDVLVKDALDDRQSAFIARQSLLFLATADAEGRPTCSYKGGEPGFVRVVDERTVAFPSYDGNGMYLSAGNVLVNPNVGLLFLDLTRGRRLRLDGVATVDLADPLLATYPEAQFVVRVRVRALYPNCPRYLHRHELVERSAYVPQAGVSTPVPEWKRESWASDVLAGADPARQAPAAQRPAGKST